MAKQSTTTVVLHDAHVAARAAAGAAFVAAYQGVCCFIAAVAVAYVARRAVRADRAAAIRVAHAAAKAATAARVARKEAAEQYASRCAKRAAAKKAAAPAARAAKKAAAAAAKAIKALNECRIMAVRAQRMAAKANAVSVTPVHAVAVPAATTAAMAVRAATTADVRATRAAIVAFLAMTPCLAALWFIATFDVAARASDKEVAKAANKVHARIKAPRVPMNNAAKRAAITMACMSARKANIQAIASNGNVLSPATKAARAAQGAAQKAANAARKAATPAKAPRPHVVIVRSGPVKNKGAKRTKVHHMVHTVESVMAQVAKKAAIVKAKEDAQIAKAKKWAMRKAAYANRKAAMEVIAADAWMLKGVWLSEDLIRGANDWSYQVRIAAFKEARAIAYPPKTKAVATTGVAA